MKSFRNAIRTINEKPVAKLFFILLIASIFVSPLFVYVHNFNVIRDVDNFIEKGFEGGKITGIEEVQRHASRGRYKRIEVDGQDSPTYPILITDFYSDTLIKKGHTIWKDAKSNHFKINTGTAEVNYELSDQRRSRTIELIIIMTAAIGLFGVLTLLGVALSSE